MEQKEFTTRCPICGNSLVLVLKEMLIASYSIGEDGILYNMGDDVLLENEAINLMCCEDERHEIPISIKKAWGLEVDK